PRREALGGGNTAAGVLHREQQLAVARSREANPDSDFAGALGSAGLSREGRAALAEFEQSLFEAAGAEESRRRMVHNTAHVLGFVDELDPLQEEAGSGSATTLRGKSNRTSRTSAITS